MRFALAGAVALLLLGLGLWAMVAPEAFYRSVATYPPYNRHLIHDLGAFQIGLGACLALGLIVRDALLAALGGNSAGAVAHVGSHLADRSAGGHVSDLLLVGLLALLLLALTFAQLLRITPRRTSA